MAPDGRSIDRVEQVRNGVFNRSDFGASTPAARRRTKAVGPVSQDGGNDGAAVCDVGAYEVLGEERRFIYLPLILRKAS